VKLALATVFTVAVLLIACSSEKSSPLQGAGTSTDAKPLSAATATHLPTMTLAQSASPDTVEPTPTLQEPATTTPPTGVVAQNGPSFSDALEPKEGDEEVVATVQGTDVTRGDIRRWAEFWMMTDDALSRDDATHKSIVSVIDRFISDAEVERRELTATREQAKEYMRPHREACLGEHGAECREALERLGFDSNSDEYWENIALPEYGKALGEIRLRHAMIKEKGLEDANNDEIIAARQDWPDELREDAVVVWHDEGLERQYQKALASN
jgi:hypothetical protein